MKPSVIGVTLAVAVAAALPVAARAQGNPVMKQDTMGMKHVMRMPMTRATFAGAGGHQASGSYEIIVVDDKQVLKTSADLTMDPGASDVYVVLSNGPAVGQDNPVWLGKISSRMGAHSFGIPLNAMVDGKTSVVLWSKRDHAAIGVAPFDPLSLKRDMMKKGPAAAAGTPPRPPGAGSRRTDPVPRGSHSLSL